MRRSLVLLIVVAGLVTGLVFAQEQPSRARTYVIVHGAMGGGWDWRAVDSMLSLNGDRVVRVTLTGLGERVHLASPAIGLTTHIDDVVNTILWEDLHDVILIGHSYGGMVITGAADKVPDRIRRLVYLDAFLPDSGETALAFADSIGATFIRSGIRDGFIVPGWVTDDHAVPRDVPQPLRTFSDTAAAGESRGPSGSRDLRSYPGARCRAGPISAFRGSCGCGGARLERRQARRKTARARRKGPRSRRARIARRKRTRSQGGMDLLVV